MLGVVSGRARRATVLASLVAALGCLDMSARPAAAAISRPATIDGPSASVIDLGGVAMAADGSAGVVYRKRVEGRAHIFAARFDGRAWGAAQRIDVGQSFDSSWPQIAAGEGGRLLVTWVQEFGTGVDRMFSASLGPGAASFQAPIPVDLNVGEATATFPSLAMNAVGTAYLAYRVVYSTSQSNSALPSGTADADVRVARTTGALWHVIGQPIDRNPAAPVALPNAVNSPRIGVDRNGNALVAWQEPGDEGYDRIWARRVFGLSLGNVLQVSPSRLGPGALQSGADAFSLAVAGFGEAAVAFRQRATAAAGLALPRIFTNTIPEAFSETAADFAGARIADGAPGAGPGGALGPPSVSVTPLGKLLVGYGAGFASFAASGDDEAPGPAERLDEGASAVAGDPVVQLSEDGAAASAWKVLRGGSAGIGVQEKRADGVLSKDLLSAPAGGVVADVRSGGSGLGDAALAFLQGSGSQAQIATAIVDAPPQQFDVLAPTGFTRSSKIKITWEPAEHAIGGVRYAVAVDDESVKEDVQGTQATLRRGDIANGVSTVVVTATDDAGQPTEGVPVEVKVDRRKPRVTFKRRGRLLIVSVSDGRRGQSSGVRARATTISFGQGKRVRAKRRSVRHRYTRAGVFRVTVKTRDRAGNRRTVRRRVRVG